MIQPMKINISGTLTPGNAGVYVCPTVLPFLISGISPILCTSLDGAQREDINDLDSDISWELSWEQ